MIISAASQWKSLSRFSKIRISIIVILIATIALFSFVVATKWLEKNAEDGRIIEKTRTHRTVLLLADGTEFASAATGLLSELPTVSALHGNGLRFVEVPSLGIMGKQADYAVAIYLTNPSSADAMAILSAKGGADGKDTVRRRAFRIPLGEYNSVMAKFDQITSHWEGEARLCTDGISVAFERIKDGHITSGTGDAACSPHYEALSLLVARLIERHEANNSDDTDKNAE